MKNPPTDALLSSLKQSFVPATYVHGGPVSARRFEWVRGETPNLYRRIVAAGADLLDSVIDWAGTFGAPGAGFIILRGAVAKLEVMTGRPDLTAGRVATFHGPHVIDCPASVLGGQGVIGATPSGPSVHAHAVFVDAAGRVRGCHMIRGRCIAGTGGITVAFAPIRGARFIQQRDAETNFDLLFPVPSADTPAGAPA